jgi:hypothetical protein
METTVSYLFRNFRQQAPTSVCSCRHSGDGHGSDHRGGIGLGFCSRTGCFCEKFVWAGWTAQFKDYAKLNKLRL